MTIPNTGGYETWTTVDASVTLPAGQQTLTVDQDSNGWNFHFMTFTLTSGGGGTPPPSGDAPFGGTPAAVPGTVQAANYDTGGQGVAYNVTAANGTANSYRSDGVDLEATADTSDTGPAGAGYDIGWTAAGQWFKYTVEVATAGTYTVSLRVAAPTAVADALHIDNSSGTNLTGSVAIAATGSYQTWATVTASVTLAAGQQTLTVDQDAAGWNLHYLAFTQGSGGSPPPPPPRPRPDRVLRHPGPRAGRADHGLLDPGRHRLPGVRRHRRRPRHPLVQRGQRPAVAGYRPRFSAADLQRGHPVGGRVRLGVLDPGVE